MSPRTNRVVSSRPSSTNPTWRPSDLQAPFRRPPAVPAYHPATPPENYLYRHLNRVASSGRLERESWRNIELIWLTGRLMPDFKTLAEFHKHNGPAIQARSSSCCAAARACSASLSPRSTGADSRWPDPRQKLHLRQGRSSVGAARASHGPLPSGAEPALHLELRRPRPLLREPCSCRYRAAAGEAGVADVHSGRHLIAALGNRSPPA